jgi:GNAT superfamily N-acetyltransferase
LSCTNLFPADETVYDLRHAEGMCVNLFDTASFHCTEMTAPMIPRLQDFFESNPEYHVAVGGRAPRPGEAREEFESLPPPEWPFERKWVIEFSADDGEMIGMADVISNLFVRGVWHIGLFVIATRLRGQGAAYLVYDGLEAWMRDNGARWSRLGVVEGNQRAGRFWEKLGYIEVRRRPDVKIGERTHNLRVMVKPLATATISEYLALVARDREESR